MPKLIVDKGPDQSRDLSLEEGAKLVFGRDESCDFVVSDPSASRRHFAVIEKGGNYYVKDLKSTHGTLINDAPVETKKLEDGDRIQVGETVFQFALSDAPVEIPAEEVEINLDAGSDTRGLAGRNIAGYQVIERIGRGGMGTVFRAKQIALDREVALKVLSHRYSDDKTFINRFFKEAQAAARLNHPNVVQIYDVREEKGLYLISMEMMDSGTVEELVQKEGPLPIARVLSIARDAAQGLVYAEKKGIVHRDIKPDNLMLNADGHVKISDLGLAHDSSAGGGQGGDEGIFGTPHFIAPEQARGKEVDSRSDIYSLGASLYRLLSGQTPFSGSSVGEIIKQQIHDEPTPLGEHRPEIPSDFCDLIEVMMAKDPADRFETAEQLLEAVTSLGSSGKIGGDRASSLMKIGGLALALIVLGGAAWFFTRPDEKTPKNDGPKVDTTTNGSNAGGGETEEQKKERIHREKSLEVDRLFLEAQQLELALKRDTKDGVPEELDKLAAAFQKAHDFYPEAEKSKVALQEVTRITALAAQRRTEIAEEETARAERLANLERTWTNLQSEVDEDMKADRFAKALATTLTRKEELRGTTYEGSIETLEKKVLETAARRSTEVRSESRGALDKANFDDARQTLREAIAAWDQELGEGAAFETLRSQKATFRSELDAIEGLERAKRDADRRHDESLVFDSLKSMRSDLASTMDYASRRASLEEAKKSLRSGAGLDRLERALAGLGRLEAARNFLAEYISTNSARPLTVSSSAKVLPRGTVVAADATEGLTIERRSNRQVLPWAKADFSEAYRYLLKRAASKPADWLIVGWACLECGMMEEAEKALDEIENKDLGPLREDHQLLRREFDAEKAAFDQLAKISATYKKAKGGDSQAWFSLNREIRDYFRLHRGARATATASGGGRFFRDPGEE